MKIEVLGVLCDVLQDKVLAEIAHPGEASHSQYCDRCKLVAHPLTGSAVLVWGFHTGDYTVSRNDPSFPQIRDSWPSSEILIKS